jgi:methionyl-tRNA synthetase
MKIRRYDDNMASAAHSGTIRAHEVLPKDGNFSVPFSSAWGYLASAGELEKHSHPSDEIYIIFKGKGLVSVGEEYAEVECGDIIEIPANQPHNIKNLTTGELLWLAFWWEKK